MLALILVILHTESMAVPLSDSLPGRALRAYFNERYAGVFPRNRLCQGVLVLPRQHSDYLRGRRRQAVRTNLRKAAAMGISCEPTHERSLALDHVLEILTNRDGSVTGAQAKACYAVIAQPELTLVAARDARGRPLACAGVVIDDAICLIRIAVACSHEARWALHDYLVRILIARGISYLVAGGPSGPFGALGFASNVQHYQHLLGYELLHMTPNTTRLPLGRRLLAIVVITLTSLALLLPDAAAARRCGTREPAASHAPLEAPHVVGAELASVADEDQARSKRPSDCGERLRTIAGSGTSTATIRRPSACWARKRREPSTSEAPAHA